MIIVTFVYCWIRQVIKAGIETGNKTKRNKPILRARHFTHQANMLHCSPCSNYPEISGPYPGGVRGVRTNRPQKVKVHYFWSTFQNYIRPTCVEGFIIYPPWFIPVTFSLSLAWTRHLEPCASSRVRDHNCVCTELIMGFEFINELMIVVFCAQGP